MKKLENVLCCGQPVNIAPDNFNGQDGFGVWCEKCGKGGFGITEDEAVNNFKNPSPVVNNQPIRNVSPDSLPAIFEQKRHGIEIMASPAIVKTGAMERLMHNNTNRYPLALTGTAWDKVWNSPIGQDSIVKGIEDAMIMGIELGKMGDLVPFGESCQLIPSIEAYEFCLTNGS